jgi:hypothetical protein
MKKVIIVVATGAIVALGILLGGLPGLPKHPYQLVSHDYNFSAAFPDTPEVTHSVNDEGLPKVEWVLKHDHGTWAEYFRVSATCYNEVLDPDKEFGGDADPALALNGVTVLKSARISVQALETGRDLPAYTRVSKDAPTGNIMAHTVILDNHCMIDSGSRVNKNEGAASLFMENVKILK